MVKIANKTIFKNILKKSRRASKRLNSGEKVEQLFTQKELSPNQYYDNESNGKSAKKIVFNICR
jgi:hypothetical protein